LNPFSNGTIYNLLSQPEQAFHHSAYAYTLDLVQVSVQK